MKTWIYTPEKWRATVFCWLARRDNLPKGCLAKHLWRILT